MKNKLTRFGQVLLLAVLSAWLPFCATAQQITVNRVYDFSGNADTLNSQINYVYADSNLIIALGEAYPKGKKPFAFTAAFDYSGNLLWKRPIRLPDSLYSADFGYNNLTKVKPGVYVAGGNVDNAPKAGGYEGGEPFLYFFNAQGDSLRMVRLHDSLNDELMSALAVTQEGHIIVGSGKIPVDSQDDHMSGRFFLRELNESGGLIRQRSYDPVAHFWYYAHLPHHNLNGRNSLRGITRIIPVTYSNSFRYIVVSNLKSPLDGGGVLWMDSTLRLVVGPFMFSGAVSMPLYTALQPFTDYEMNFIERKNHPNSFYWAFPAKIFNTPYYDMSGVYFARARMVLVPDSGYCNYSSNWYKALTTDTSFMPFNSAFGFKVQGRSELAEAVNGDLLVQREMYQDTDNRATDTTFLAHLFYFPVLIRTSDTGHIKWWRSFRYVHSADSSVFQQFYDLSVAPDGKIVMGGFVRSRYPVIGYDTVGKVSWLVILSDTLHDHQQQPPEPAGILAVQKPQIQLSVYPNPTQNTATLDLQRYRGSLRGLSWQLCAMDGRMLQSGKLTNRKTDIDLSRFAPGTYFINVWHQGAPVGRVELVKD